MIFAFSLGERVVNHFASRCGRLTFSCCLLLSVEDTYHFALPRKQDEVAGNILAIFIQRSGKEEYT